MIKASGESRASERNKSMAFGWIWKPLVKSYIKKYVSKEFLSELAVTGTTSALDLVKNETTKTAVINAAGTLGDYAAALKGALANDGKIDDTEKATLVADAKKFVDELVTDANEAKIQQALCDKVDKL